jgi:hypothetical protein
MINQPVCQMQANYNIVQRNGKKGQPENKIKKILFHKPKTAQVVTGDHLNAQLKGQLSDVAVAKIQRALELNTATKPNKSLYRELITEVISETTTGKQPSSPGAVSYLTTCLSLFKV